MKDRSRALAAALALVLGLVVAMLLDMASVTALGEHRAVAVLGGALVGSGVAALCPTLLRRPTSRALVASGALLAGTATFILVRCQLGWLDLGPIGAGTPTQMPLVIAPFVSVLVALATWPRR